MVKERIKICLVGCGMIGRIHGQNFLKRNDEIELYVCDVDETIAHNAADEFDAKGVFTEYEQVLRDDRIDAVDICLPHHLHEPFAISAFEAGKHFFLEKPIANSLAQCDSIIEAAQNTGLVFAVSENFRFEPAIRRAIELIDQGVIGKPFLIMMQEMSYFVEVTANMRAYDWRRRESTGGGGVLFDRGVHLMAAVNQLGGPVKSVYAQTLAPANVWEVDETSVVTFTHENGIVTTLIESWNLRSAPPAPMMAIYGTEGSIVEAPDKRIPGHGPFEMGGLVVCSSKLEQFQAQLDEDLFEDAKLYIKMMLNAEVPDDVLQRSLAKGIDVDIISEFGTYSVYDESIMNFVECIRTGSKPHVAGKEARADVELVFAAYESARTGQPIELPLAS